MPALMNSLNSCFFLVGHYSSTLEECKSVSHHCVSLIVNMRLGNAKQRNNFAWPNEIKTDRKMKLVTTQFLSPSVPIKDILYKIAISNFQAKKLVSITRLGPKVHRLTLPKGVYALRYFLSPMPNLLMHVFFIPIYASPDFVYALRTGNTSMSIRLLEV